MARNQQQQQKKKKKESNHITRKGEQTLGMLAEDPVGEVWKYT